MKNIIGKLVKFLIRVFHIDGIEVSDCPNQKSDETDRPIHYFNSDSMRKMVLLRFLKSIRFTNRNYLNRYKDDLFLLLTDNEMNLEALKRIELRLNKYVLDEERLREYYETIRRTRLCDTIINRIDKTVYRENQEYLLEDKGEQKLLLYILFDYIINSQPCRYYNFRWNGVFNDTDNEEDKFLYKQLLHTIDTFYTTDTFNILTDRFDELYRNHIYSIDDQSTEILTFFNNTIGSFSCGSDKYSKTKYAFHSTYSVPVPIYPLGCLLHPTTTRKFTNLHVEECNFGDTFETLPNGEIRPKIQILNDIPKADLDFMVSNLTNNPFAVDPTYGVAPIIYAGILYKTLDEISSKLIERLIY